MGYRGRDLAIALSNSTPSALGVPSPGTSLEASRSDHVHEVPVRPISTGLVNNSGVSLGSLNTNVTVDIDLNTGATWTVSTLVSDPAATVQSIISPTVVGQPALSGRILEYPENKRLNIFRVILVVSYSGGGGDGTIEMSIVNPSGVVIDQESKPINIDGSSAVDERLSFRFFAVKTSDNNIGYKIRLRNFSKALTAYRIVSVLHDASI